MILGRFQVFHKGHLRYLLKARGECDHIIIGITNPDPMNTRKTESALHRDKNWANPLTYYERLKMIQGVCDEVNITKEKYDIIPLPLDNPENIKYYIPKDSVIMVTIHDDWSLEKKLRLEKQGYEVKVLFDEYNLKKLSSTEIRECIANNKEYFEYVPISVYNYLRDNLLDVKIREILKNSDF